MAAGGGLQGEHKWFTAGVGVEGGGTQIRGGEGRTVRRGQ